MISPDQFAAGFLVPAVLGVTSHCTLRRLEMAKISGLSSPSPLPKPVTALRWPSRSMMFIHALLPAVHDAGTLMNASTV
ncbi:hypothetical protein D3C79_1094540 [compost metagenome]